MSVAINYDLGKDPSTLREVFGMQVAVYDWFTAFFRYCRQEKIYCLIGETQSFQDLLALADKTGMDKERLVALDRRFVQENFQHFTTIFRPDPNAEQLLWQRQAVTGPGYAFCGLAHAISGLETGELLEQYCLAPSMEGDAIVCPSRAVQAAIRQFWDLYEEYIAVHFGARYRCPVELPIIPLGLECDRFTALTTSDKRAEQRSKLGVTEHSIVLLWVGRLSHAIKAHPLAMFLAAERAAERTGADVHLVMQGYFVPLDAEIQFTNLAKAFCKKAKVTFVGNKDPRFPDGLWASGDIFLSLVDNIQESFGLTPIEAMAAGLPRVVSDWDGYRDSVTDGVDGFLIPTTQPAAGNGADLSALLLSGREMYGGYLAKTALSTAVDIEAAVEALSRLITDKNLRHSFAFNARRRVKNEFSWQSIIPQYEALFHEQGLKRRSNGTPVKRPYPSLLPQCPDPFTMYQSYPTSVLAERDRLSGAVKADQIKALWQHDINTFGLDMMIAPTAITELTNFITQKTDVSVADIENQFSSLSKPALLRTLTWLLKLGILKRKRAP